MPATHRPAQAPVLGLRAGEDGVLIPTQTIYSTRSLFSAAQLRIDAQQLTATGPMPAPGCAGNSTATFDTDAKLRTMDRIAIFCDRHVSIRRRSRTDLRTKATVITGEAPQ